MALVLGKDIAFNLIFPEGNSTVVCARNSLLDIQTETVETTAPGSGGFKSFKKRKIEWNAACDGVINVGAGYGYHYLRMHQLAGTAIQIQFVITDMRGGSYLFTGNGIIMGTSSNGNYNDAGLFNVDFKGTGSLLISTFADPDSPYICDEDDMPLEDWDGSWFVDYGGDALTGDFISSDFSAIDFLV